MTRSLTGSSGVTGERSAVDGGVSAACEPFSCFTHARLRWRHKKDASRDSLDGDTMQVLEVDGTDWLGFSKASRLDIFSAKITTPHSEDSCRRHLPHRPPQAVRTRRPLVVKHIPPVQGLRSRAGRPWTSCWPPWTTSSWSLVWFAAEEMHSFEV